MGVAGAAAALRGLLGVGEGNDGWRPVSRGISGPGVEMTHPEWKQAWKGSRVKAYRRLGRTDFEISDIVLGSGPLKGDEGTEIASLAIEPKGNGIDCAEEPLAL